MLYSVLAALSAAMPESIVSGMSPTRARIDQRALLHYVTMARDPLYYTWSSSYLCLYIYLCQEVPCLYPFLIYSLLAAATAVYLVSLYLQSPLSISIRPFQPFLESQPLCLYAKFLYSSMLYIKSSFIVVEYSVQYSYIRYKVPLVSNCRITKDKSSLVICADLVVCRRVTTPPRGATGTNCLFYVLLHQVQHAVYLGH